jgi:putative hydroxymethylpyrimidine transport system substrate-binding protein
LRAPYGSRRAPSRTVTSPGQTLTCPSRTSRARGRRRRTRPTLALALSLLGLLALAACGSKQDTLSASATKPWTVMLDFFPNADHAALYEGIANGDFKAGGLDVRPQTPADPATPLKLLAAGRVDMAISYEPELLLARDQGLRLVSIGALVQRPLTSIIALPNAHVRKVADLAGKRVGTAGIGYQTAELRTALEAAGVSPSQVREANVGFNLVPAMLSGKVDATLGGYWNYEALQLEQMRRRPVVIPIDQAGVPSYDELVLVVREDEAGTRGQDLRAFMQGLITGEQQARKDPEGAAKLIVKANPSAQEKLQLASIEATLPATLPAGKKPYGWQDPSAWAAFGHWMFAHKLIQGDPNRAGLPPFTNEFLPGEGI